MKLFKAATLFSISLLVLSCSSNNSDKNVLNTKTETEEIIPPEPVQDGIYRVLNEYTDSVKAASETGRVIPYSHDFLDDSATEPGFIEIATDEFVALKLRRSPEGIEQADKRINLMLTLTDSSGKALEDFTEKYIDQRVAMVIGQKVVTLHKIREKIIGGAMQVTRCTDNACEHLMIELQDNVVEDLSVEKPN